ncbi:DUF4062 domain-containing protein [Aromatoleum toluclasticum]|uniref:DUF4062 domain-containing protein n=1 Tax=Aromatoleum toluclasticum TaxID=92003 RepID=UPI001D18850C|nr:DUF4062 domain-containing protein [Aromatoleum toluclasticum]MCC4115980.1 DUF4062 domain-containing protein [Aromatoleum toluclasticum]
MANLRVFISSICYDLSVVRGQLRDFIESIGYEPVMSDYNDVVYDPRAHTHTSCIEEVSSCDVVVVIIGSRFGGKVVPQALASVDIDSLKSASKSIETLKRQESISITQLEVLKAIEKSIPVFAFVDERVSQNHLDYEKNKNKPFIDSFEFSSIEKPETARFIFEFINFLRHRSINNSVTNYSKYQDIEDALQKQWSGLFQRLLSEQRNKQVELRRIDALTEQFEDLKAAILTTVGSKNEREVARGVVRFRRLFDFLRGFELPDYSFILNETHSWNEFLKHLGIVEIREVVSDRDARIYGPRSMHFLLKEDGTFYETRFPLRIADLSMDWEALVRLEPDSRAIIFDALNEMRVAPANRYVRYIPMALQDYLAKNAQELRFADDEPDPEPQA